MARMAAGRCAHLGQPSCADPKLVTGDLVGGPTARPPARGAQAASRARRRAMTRCATASGLRSRLGSTSPRYLPRRLPPPTTPRSGHSAVDPAQEPVAGRRDDSPAGSTAAGPIRSNASRRPRLEPPLAPRVGQAQYALGARDPGPTPLELAHVADGSAAVASRIARRRRRRPARHRVRCRACSRPLSASPVRRTPVTRSSTCPVGQLCRDRASSTTGERERTWSSTVTDGRGRGPRGLGSPRDSSRAEVAERAVVHRPERGQGQHGVPAPAGSSASAGGRRRCRGRAAAPHPQRRRSSGVSSRGRSAAPRRSGRQPAERTGPYASAHGPSLDRSEKAARGLWTTPASTLSCGHRLRATYTRFSHPRGCKNRV